jgi:divalent metal cation (Fe/Co/Zn/Cd) transporter
MGWLFYVDMHVEVDPQMTVQRAHEIAHVVKDEVRRELPVVHDVLVHIEPAGQQAAARGQRPEVRGRRSEAGSANPEIRGAE